MKALKITEEPMFFITYGAGALGNALVADAFLAWQDPKRRSKIRLPVFGVTETQDFERVEFDSTSLSLRASFPIKTIRPGEAFQACLDTCQNSPLVLILSVPPQQLATSLEQCLEGLERTARHAPTTIFVASNGLLPERLLERVSALAESQGQLILLRGIVISGFWAEWKESTGTLTVHHTSGQTLLWGALTKPTPEHPPAPLICGPLFRATRTPAIRQIEFRKIFVNAVLGWWTGPKLLPNEKLTSLLTQEEASGLAECFAGLFPHAGSAADLCSALWQTAKETGANINSVSRAWAAGDGGLAFYFQELIESALRQGPPAIAQTRGCQLWRHQFSLYPQEALSDEKPDSEVT